MMPRGTTNLPRRCGARVGGFTLLELIAVLVILAAIAALVVPALTSISATRQREAASRLVRDLQLARQRSVAAGLRTWVVIDADADRYSLFIEDTASPGRAGRVPMIDDATGRDFVVSLDRGEWRGAAIEAIDFGGGNEFAFDRRGRPLIGDDTPLTDDATISLSGGHIVRITARTGQVQRMR